MARTEIQLREQMNSYGRRIILSSKQINILQFALQKVQKENLSPIEVQHVQRLLDMIRRQLDEVNHSDKDSLRSVIQSMKRYIAELESNTQSKNLLALLEKHHVYSMLYHAPKLKAEKDDSGLMEALKAGFIGVAIAAVFVGIFVAVPFLALPAWVSIASTGLFAASVAYVSTLIYGLVNDYYATKASLPYFLLGHQPQQHSLLNTNNPLTQGIVWGVAATFGPALLASIAFGIAASVTASFVPVATFIFPLVLIGMPLIAYGAELYARRKANEMVEKGYDNGEGDYIDLDFISFDRIPDEYLNSYEKNGLRIMCTTKEDKAAWFSTGARNGFGFKSVPLIGVGMGAAVVGLSLSSAALPAVLFSPVVAVVVPAALALLGISILTAAGIYAYKHRDDQIDNRFKLAVDQTPSNDDELYIEDDLVNEYEHSLSLTTNTEEDEVDQRHFSSPLSTPHYRPALVVSSEEQRLANP